MIGGVGRRNVHFHGHQGAARPLRIAIALIEWQSTISAHSSNADWLGRSPTQSVN
jgi:hypothetical protein